jgi:hypothetical protein
MPGGWLSPCAHEEPAPAAAPRTPNTTSNTFVEAVADLRGRSRWHIPPGWY